MSFVGNGDAALALAEESAFDVVVSDLHMRGLDGLGLLSEIKQRVPHAVRIVLSGTADRDTAMRAIGIAHQFLAKPCSPEELQATVQRAFALRELLSDDRLVRITTKLAALPPLPALHLEITQTLSSGKGSIEDVGRIVAKDVSMSAKVLHLANSAFFGSSKRFTSAVDATVYLGLDTITALVLTSQVFTQSSSFDLQTLERWRIHGVRVGTFARQIFKLEGRDPKTSNEAFLAGMLHDVGHLVLGGELADELTSAWRFGAKHGIPPHEAERRLLGASHAAIGAYLLGIWGLPDPVVEAIAFHHTPSECKHDTLSIVTAVHVATALESSLDRPLPESERDLDRLHLERLGLLERLPAWQESCLDLVQRAPAN
jgi:HD-like signal output (HDOD) protein